MKVWDNRIILILIVSITLLTAELEQMISFSLQEKLESGENAYVLLIGADPRPGEIYGRSDTLILSSFNTEMNKIVLVSIPRDTKIQYKGSSRKINIVNQNEGPEAACREVGKLMNVQVSHYLLADFKGFEKVIDLLGGVWVNVDINIYSSSSGVKIEKGYQQLTGKEALQYARFRSNPDADIGRTLRQQRLLTAIVEQAFKPETIPKLPRLIRQLKENVSTNISLSDCIYIAGLGLKIDENTIITQTLPGYHYIDPYSGASFWEVDPQLNRSIIESLYKGHRYDVILETPPWR